jgi:hypothetical protein
VTVLLRLPGLAIAQEGSCWLLTAEAWVHPEGSPCGTWAQSGTRTSFSSTSVVGACRYHSTAAAAAYLLVSYGR